MTVGSRAHSARTEVPFTETFLMFLRVDSDLLPLDLELNSSSSRLFRCAHQDATISTQGESITCYKNLHSSYHGGFCHIIRQRLLNEIKYNVQVMLKKSILSPAQKYLANSEANFDDQ